MKKLLKNWKTTFFGFATIIGGVAAILKERSSYRNYYNRCRTGPNSCKRPGSNRPVMNERRKKLYYCPGNCRPYSNY
jgi:hypothetical protein